jgi:SOS-response transcriptional repressor LexA
MELEGRDIINNLKVILGENWAKELIHGLKLKKATVYSWSENNTVPKFTDLLRIAKHLGKTVEELAEGEKGLDYVRRLIAKEGRLWEPPERILAIVRALDRLDEDRLETVKTMITALAYQTEALEYPLFTGESVPEYGLSMTKSAAIESVRLVDWNIVILPFYGKTAAGIPIDISALPDLGVPYPRQKLHGSVEDHFVVQVLGTSMTQAGILDGYYAIIRRAEEPLNNKIMLVRYGNESTLKRIKIRGGKVYLCWEDGSGERRLVDSSEYEIQGEYVGALHE